MTQGCVVKDTLASVASTMFLAQAGHCISERDREVQEGKGSTVTIWVVPRSQETFPPHIASLQGLVNSCQGRLLKFGAASPQTDSINTHQRLRHQTPFNVHGTVLWICVFSPLGDSFPRQVVWVASKAQQREHLKTADAGTGSQAPFLLKLSTS